MLHDFQARLPLHDAQGGFLLILGRKKGQWFGTTDRPVEGLSQSVEGPEGLREALEQSLVLVAEQERRLFDRAVALDRLPRLKSKKAELWKLRRQSLELSRCALAMEQICEEAGDDPVFERLGLRAERAAARAERLREETGDLLARLQAEREERIGRNNLQLAVVATVFLPITFVTGWYGMNFEHMPELTWPDAYPAVVVVCLFLAGFAYWWSRHGEND